MSHGWGVRRENSHEGATEMRHQPRHWLAVASAITTLGLVLAACGGSARSDTAGGPAATPGITATSITIGTHQPLTGVASPGYDEIAPASNAVFADVNAHGGIHGRKIRYLIEDDAYNPAQTKAVVDKLVLQDHVFAIFNGLGTPTHVAVVPFLNANKVPDLFVSSGCDCWNDPSKYPYTSGYSTDYTVEGKVEGKYVADHYKGQGVGYLAQSDEFGQDGIMGLDQSIPQSTVVSRQTYDVTDPTANVGPQMQALQSAGAQVVVLYAIPAFVAHALQAAAKVNYHPHFVVSSVGASNPENLSHLLGDPSLLDGLATDYYLPSVSDTADPWIKLFRRIHDRYLTSVPFDANVEYGMAVGYTFVRLMEQAGQNPTRDSVMKALQTADLAGPGLSPLGYSSTSNQGYTGVQMGTIHGGKLALSGPVFTSTDNGPVKASKPVMVAPPKNL